MKEELQGKLLEILTSIQTAAGKASDFALEQLPDIAQQYVLYGRIKSAVLSAAFLFVATAALAYARWAYKNPWNTSNCSWDAGNKRSESNYAAMALGTTFGFIFGALGCATFDFLVWFAPKVWLLKELAALIK